MHNGVGLQSSRGSGTNGYVRKNLANHVRSKDRDNSKKLNENSVSSLRKLNNEIVEHDRKRKLEIKCLELQQMLEDEGYPDDEIEKRVSSYRLSLTQEFTSTTTKDKHKRTRTKETLENVATRIRKNDQLRKAFDISERFAEGSNFDAERRAHETAVEQTRHARASLSPSSEEEEGEIADERTQYKPKKRSRKSSSPKISESKKKKKKKKKKKHKRKSKSESHRKKKARHSRHEDKHDRRTETPERAEDRVAERYGESRTRRRSETPEQYQRGRANSTAKEKSTKTKGFRSSKMTEQHRRSTADSQIAASGSDSSRGKRRSRTPEQARYSDVKNDKNRKRRASDKRSPSTEDVHDYRLSSAPKRRRRCSEMSEEEEEEERQHSVHDEIEPRRNRRFETPEKYASEKRAHHPEDKPSRRDKARAFPERTNSVTDARYCRLMSASTTLSSKKFGDETNSKTSRTTRRSPNAVAAEYKTCHPSQAKSAAKKDEKNDKRNENSLVLRYFDSEVETDEGEEESSGKTTTPQCKDENDHRKRRVSPFLTLQPRRNQRDGCRSPKPPSGRCSKSPSYSPPPPPPKSSQLEAAVPNEIPKKICRPESGNERRKETLQTLVVEGVPNHSRSNVEREAASKSRTAVERVEDEASKTKFEAIGRPLKNVEMQTAVSPPKVDPTIQSALHRPPDTSNVEVEQKGAESGQKMPTAADMVDEAVKKTITALALNREKTLESFKKLLSYSLPKGKKSDSGSSLKTLRLEQRSASSSSGSGSSDSSQSSRSRDLSTSFSENSSESSNCSRASSRGHSRKRKHRSRALTKVSRRSRRRSSSKSSDASGSCSSRSCGGSSSGSSSREEEKKKKKKRRKKDRFSSSSSSSSSRSRSTSIPRRKGSPSFLERRRITSNKKKNRSPSSSASTSSGSYANSSLSSSE